MKLILFCSSLSMWHTILALSIPQHHTQQPLLPEQHLAKLRSTTNVILAFTGSGSHKVQHIEVPLKKQIHTGLNLPAYLDEIKIEAVVNKQGQSASLEELGHVMCRVVPRLSAEEKAAFLPSGLEKVIPWFRVRDETVLFQRSSSRWFLGGRAIESYECR
ncbi:hypothetical protein GQ44DRAFT_127943 [Phaeosphaeriaceae sp. PMI808]|nr:hypothetical protein GQ44DRAFT_127943 [Phaeosphaeriaceae sp. PMI808]